MIETKAYAAMDAKSPLQPWSLQRRRPGARDVHIAIDFCGVCHSDLHAVRNEWRGSIYPLVPGHEVIGRVVEVGSAVRGFRPGDRVGVGCMVGSCRHCASCQDGLEQYCDRGFVGTYGTADPHGGQTYGGYSERIVVDEHFVLRIPTSLDPAAAAPLLCAGITTYSPLRHWKAGPGQKIGVVGLGGLGHLAVKFARAMGAHVVQFTTSPSKRQDALRLGAHEVVVSANRDEMAPHVNSFDLILNTVAVPHELDPFLWLLKRDGKLALIGVPAEPHPSPRVFSLALKRRSIVSSLIGGIAETQEMLDFCAKHGIVSDIELIPIQAINEAYERMLRSDVKYRFVIDMTSLKAAV